MTERLSAAVYSALNAARENGFVGSDGTLMDDWSDEDIAADMLAFDTDLGDCEEDEIIPYIRYWREHN